MALPLPTRAAAPRERTHHLPSRHLGRAVELSVLLPPRYRINLLHRYPVVLLNDGQDFGALELRARLAATYRARIVTPMIIVGLHADERRMREYGTSGGADYAGRGDLADAHRRFVTEELVPWLRAAYRTRADRRAWAIGGFSLGGLSAFDIAWHHELLFGHVGCFSASFWWRATPFDEGDPDAGRVAVDRTARAVRAADLSYFFAVGSAEEDSDRNGNGVIDAVDDTLDVIAALRDLGVPGADVHYHYVEGGRHDHASWGPALLVWLARLWRK